MRSIGADAAVEIFEVVDHHLVPKPARLEVAHQELVHHREVAGHVGFHIEVLVGGLDRLRDAADVGDRRRRRDRHHVRVAHADGRDAARAGDPSRASCGRSIVETTARASASSSIEIDRQNALAPQRALEATDSVRARRPDRPRPRSRRTRSPPCWCRRRPPAASDAIAIRSDLKRFLKAHQAEPDGAMPHVGAARFGNGVEIDVDDVVEHPHRGGHRRASAAPGRAAIRPTWLSRLIEPRLQTATSSSEVFSVISVQRFEEWITPAWRCGERRLQGP